MILENTGAVNTMLGYIYIEQESEYYNVPFNTDTCMCISNVEVESKRIKDKKDGMVLKTVSAERHLGGNINEKEKGRKEKTVGILST